MMAALPESTKCEREDFLKVETRWKSFLFSADAVQGDQVVGPLKGYISLRRPLSIRTGISRAVGKGEQGPLEGGSSAKRFRVLIADDEARIVNFVRIKLKAHGYDVVTARNGDEALEQVHTSKPDLVLLNLSMPVKDGMEALRELRTFSKVPVVVMSAMPEDKAMPACLSLGADSYLLKPFDPDDLLERIETTLGRESIPESKQLPKLPATPLLDHPAPQPASTILEPQPNNIPGGPGPKPTLPA
ncbi:MAG: response regulator [Chloroflexi bacterium]|nr:response regulator [Chloroflexota bacterium]